jgi:hypothetical protein
MDAEQFPSFEESGWYRDWLAMDVAGLFESEAQKAEMLAMGRRFYYRVRKRWESDRRHSRGDDVELVS